MNYDFKFYALKELFQISQVLVDLLSASEEYLGYEEIKTLKGIESSIEDSIYEEFKLLEITELLNFLIELIASYEGILWGANVVKFDILCKSLNLIDS